MNKKQCILGLKCIIKNNALFVMVLFTKSENLCVTFLYPKNNAFCVKFYIKIDCIVNRRKLVDNEVVTNLMVIDDKYP